MPKITNDDNNTIKQKLEYIGLDLNKIPNYLKENNPLEYRLYRTQDENSYRVYKYIDINDIQILLTPKNRLNSLKEKYLEARPLYQYLEPKTEEDILRHTTFLKMVKNLNIEEIKQLENEQEQLNKEIPFLVKYHNNYLWQIYYSDVTKQYFMLVPTEDLDYATFFYLLKKQLELYKTNKREKIYVPISYSEYSAKYFKKSEIADIEKYLWLFTKKWPMVYEVYDKHENMSLQIVGEINCYENIYSEYKIKLENREEAVTFYKLLKALFILQTELPHHFKFQAKIDKNGGIEFEYNNKKITYEDLTDLIIKEYNYSKNEIKKLSIENKELKEKLVSLKKEEKNKTVEYIQKERQIAVYLECRKTFLGKIKYFFRARKKLKNDKIEIKEENNEIKKEEISIKEYKEKEFYTIEELIQIYKELDNILLETKDLRLDVKAIENKIKSMETKIKNATLYIQEIDSHEKSIFDFWRFANKDESLMLNQGKVEEIEKNKIQKTFSYEEDIDELKLQIDKIQRTNLSKEETDAVYIATTEVINVLNNINDVQIITESLIKLKEEAENNKVLFSKENFDILGDMLDDNTKIKVLGNKKHRESKKEKLKILDISKNTTDKDYKEKLEEILQKINKAMNKSKAQINMPIYIASDKDLEKNINIFNMDAQDAINEFKDSKIINLYRINVKEKMNILYFSNIIYYDNYNNTLPIGMNVTEKGILDINKLKLSLSKKSEFRVNVIDGNNAKPKKINLYEYEAEEINDK